MIKSVEAKDFLSWEHLKFDIEDGVTLIQGYNYDDETSEGSGKSAILNAISWCIYGKLPKETNIDDVIRTGQKSCMVQVELGYDFVVRTRKPNDLCIMKYDGTGHNKIKGKDARETQKMIEDLFGLSFEAFCTSIYFAQNYDKKFITAAQEEKGKILSEIQDLELFNRARKETLELIKLEKSKIEKFDNQLREIQLKLNHADQTILMLEQHRQSKIQESAARVDTLNRKHIDLTNKIEESKRIIQDLTNKNEFINESISETREKETKDLIDTLKTDISTIQAQLSMINQQKTILNNYISDINRYEKSQVSTKRKIDKLILFIKDPSSECPTCGTVLKAKDTTHASTELAELEKEFSDIQIQINEVEEKKKAHVIPDAKEIDDAIAGISNTIRVNEKELDMISESKKEKVMLENSISNSSNLLNQLSLEVGELITLINQETSVDLSEFDQGIAKQIKDKELVEDSQNNIKLLKLEADRYMAKLETLKSGFKEIKTYIFNTVLNELMFKANRYLEELFEVQAKIIFSTEDMKINTQVILNGDSRPLGLLSGGQSRRFYLAVDLALSEIVLSRKGSKLDLRILDEYFKDLSESSMNKCLNLLERLGGSTILIEHNSLFQSIVDKTFKVELRDKVSRSV